MLWFYLLAHSLILAVHIHQDQLNFLASLEVFPDVTEVDELDIAINIRFLVFELQYLGALDELGLVWIDSLGWLLASVKSLLIFGDLWAELLLHFLDGFVNQKLSCFQKIEALDKDGVLLVLPLGVLILLAIPSRVWVEPKPPLHISVISHHVIHALINVVLNFRRQVYFHWNGGPITQVLTQIWLLHVSGVLPTRVILQEVKWQHASSEGLRIRIILEGPFHDWAASKIWSFITLCWASSKSLLSHICLLS